MWLHTPDEHNANNSSKYDLVCTRLITRPSYLYAVYRLTYKIDFDQARQQLKKYAAANREQIAIAQARQVRAHARLPRRITNGARMNAHACMTARQRDVYVMTPRLCA